MSEVTLDEILLARENRVKVQNKMLKGYNCAVISFTLNIAGPVKNSPLIKRSFYEGLNALKKRIDRKKILSQSIDISNTGCEAMLAVDEDAGVLKKICTEIEDGSSLGRLFDMDVIDRDGRKLNRNAERGCIVCGKGGRECSARRLHSIAELQTATHEIMREYFESADTERIADMAVASLLEEAYTTPKPGLVDTRNNGSHKDMDINTFVKSANALRDYFKTCFSTGRLTAGGPACETFSLLRQEGLKAEKVMYKATGGVNTHKGAIYSMGILCGAAGRLWTPAAMAAKPEELLQQCREMVIDSVKEDFKTATGATAGEKLYLEMGLRGIRGQIADGFPAVAKIGLPVYTQALKDGLSSNDAGAVTLLNLISNVEDTNLYHRGGKAGAQYASEKVRNLLSTCPYPPKQDMEKLDDDFISRNLSPGGSADLLAITYFLHKLNKKRP